MQPDNDITHLYPPFNIKVQALLNAASLQFPHVEWTITETHRTIERQLWLYTLGRTRQNPTGASQRTPMGNRVTWSRIPDLQGIGLAVRVTPRVSAANCQYDIYLGMDMWYQWADLVRACGLYTAVGVRNTMPEEYGRVTPGHMDLVKWKAAAIEYCCHMELN